MNHLNCRRVLTRRLRTRQRGVVAILVGLTIFVLMGFAGLALDLGRLFVNKSELQGAADACALAAANELVCDTSVAGISCPAQFLINARSAGIFVAGRSKRDLQKSAVSIAENDVMFGTALSPNPPDTTNYKRIGAGANTQSKYVMCTARSDGIVPWFMGVLEVGKQDVTATAVATLSPSASFCDPAPMGICSSGAAPSYGLKPGQWLESKFTPAGGEAVAGNFRWVDYTPSAGGVPDLRDILKGTAHFCGVKVGDNVNESGSKIGTKGAYNTRFGLYKVTGSTTIDVEAAAAPPDRSGYAYPTKATAAFPISFTNGGIPSLGQMSAYKDYRGKQATSEPYSKADYGLSKPANEPPPVTDHARYGLQRRVLSAPIIDCAGAVKPILAMGCILMLNPMANGASGELYIEFLGSATSASSPCRTAGVPSGGAGTGPLTPTLVQ